MPQTRILQRIVEMQTIIRGTHDENSFYTLFVKFHTLYIDLCYNTVPKV